ncbi:MAG: hypothetical protein UU16_C0013G0010 [Candidatus Woesebacteria bacterium GW2011_GWA2_40_7]|uniref:RND efflux pump membrane fusion protein barrel-sandwich domain-containing protein n=3 Tax=Candidatus Woeseibacteriota TaxID=1752722 RepID=A0A0G0PRI2_9BACT|nr:MAG: hypothetical protein UT17_C0003G0004 [Candidatus Woesebacteria bacterium GW2011_GWB1_39_10]KKR73796.1 MAG: hypothetical protein UU16_C0013G0010 [Candidatus Woesebacteria bacterium GW2011_GWA2_40_7]KKS90941.1 MAG: hypothetical protein UV66_C0001G0298 [Candidatus Woesebacteria bacterium GW2011_GWA1_43_12]
MVTKSFEGVIKARIVEARFSLSGKIISAPKHTGDIVKKWDLLASLDRKILQTELDAELSDYEKVRADFEIFGQKNPNPTEAIDKYLKTEKDAGLKGSVKAVELVKARLDQADLFSPVDGTIIDDGSLAPGLYVTPASSTIKIIDTSSYYFEVEIEQKDISDFLEPKKCKLEIVGIKEEISGESKNVFSDGKKFLVKIPVANTPGVLFGLNGKANF